MTPVDLPYTPDSARQMLAWGAMPSTSPYTHRQIADWCDRFWVDFMDSDAPPDIEKLLPVLADVDAQWDLNFCNSFPLNELHLINQDQVQLPIQWFEEWLRQATEA